jgi:hypothetical protein
MRGWTKLLTKDELRHLRQDAGCRSFAAVERTVQEIKSAELAFPCLVCCRIGAKLGLTRDHAKGD